MNHWPFIAGAYLVAIGATAGLSIASFIAMRRCERRADRIGRERG